MGTVRRPKYTRPLPTGSKITKVGKDSIATWIDQRGQQRRAPVVTRKDGSLRVRFQGSIYVARYRRADGRWEERTTGCSNREAALHLLREWEAEEDRVRCGRASRAEVDARDRELEPLLSHLEDYLAAPLDGRKAGGRSSRRLQYVRAAIERLAADCGWRTLRDVSAVDLRRWMDARATEGMSPGRRSYYLSALKAMLNWCVRDGRTASSPIAEVKPPKHEDRRKPRALDADEVEQLLDGAFHRPLHEARLVRRGPRKGQLVARIRPERERQLVRSGWERALAYKAMVLTGLRSEELASVRVEDVDLDEHNPVIILDGQRTKNGEPAVVPLRRDLAADLTEWLEERLDSLRGERRESDAPQPVRLDPRSRLLKVPSPRVFEADRKFSEIPKRNRRGEVACRRSLRRTGCTLLYDAGASRVIGTAWMRHKGSTLSERAYADRELLDVRRWLDQLPAFPLPHREEDPGHQSRATGTDGLLTRALTRDAGERGLTMRQEALQAGAHEAGLDGAKGPKSPRKGLPAGEGVERQKGLEPSTPTLARLCSTTELLPLPTGGRDYHPGAGTQGGGEAESRPEGPWRAIRAPAPPGSAR